MPKHMLERYAGLGLAFILLLAGCRKNEQAGAGEGGRAAVKESDVAVDTAGQIDPIASPDAVKGGTYNAWGGEFPKSLNYWLQNTSFSAEFVGLLFEPLVILHSANNGEVGALADTWSISPDKKVFTFHLDPRARWSDGKPVTAEDVQFFYDVMMDPKNLTSIFRVSLSRFERPKVKDSLTLEVTAKQVHWNNFWDAAGLVAFPKHVWGGQDFNQINFDFPVVSGPYRLQEVKKERSVTLQRRGDWWGRTKRYNQHKYNFDYITYHFVEDQIKLLEAFKKGDFDVNPIYTASIWAQKTDFDQVKKGWVVKQRIFNKEPIGFQGFSINLRRPLFQDARVREALCLLINRKLMNEKLMFNEYFLLNSYYPDLFPDNVNPNSPMRDYDPKRARELLSQAGWKPGPDGVLAKDGKRFEISIPNYTPEVRHLNVYLEDLKAVGIQASIEQLSFSTFSKRMDHFDYDIHWLAMGGSRLRDPEPLWASKTADEEASANYPGVKDKLVDSLIEAQKTEMSLDKRNEILKRIDDRLNQIIPYALLWQADHQRLLYWNRFGTPKYVFDKFDREDCITTYWWIDPAKDKALHEAMQSGKDLPLQPTDVRYQD